MEAEQHQCPIKREADEQHYRIGQTTKRKLRLDKTEEARDKRGHILYNFRRGIAKKTMHQDFRHDEML
tara:strand:- start:71 stop:274 length:204 start_codon:yes stop_codon:yes gene_type:complete